MVIRMLLRNVYVGTRALLFKSRLQLNDVGRMRLRVRIADLDYNMHMNNSKFVEAFEMGRLDFICRNGLISEVFK